MNTPQDGGPAFPVAIMARQTDGMPMTGFDFGVEGMSLRDWFAGMALQGYNSNREQCANMTHEQAAANAYRDADAMLKARTKNLPTT